jgi:hypothetical protein
MRFFKEDLQVMRSINLVASVTVALCFLIGCQVEVRAEASTQSQAKSPISSVVPSDSDHARATTPPQVYSDGTDNLYAADQSFSPYPLRQERLGLNTQGFTVVEDSCSPEGDECTWMDPNSVQHVLDSNNILIFKLVSASDFIDRPITALGIGAARDRAAVLRNVSGFLHETTLECRAPGEAGEGPGITSCGATLGDGWIKILFDANNRLLSARIDAYQAN